MKHILLVIALSVIAVAEASAGIRYTVTGLGGVPLDMNDLGQVLIRTGLPPKSDIWFWEKGNRVKIDIFSGRSQPVAINNSGTVVGYGPSLYYGQRNLMTWNNGTIHDLGLSMSYFGLDINDNGQILFGIDSYKSGIWDNGDITYLDFSGSKINNNGQIIIKGTASGSGNAFLVDQGIFYPLPTLGGSWSEALSLNNHKQIVGRAANTYGYPCGVLWQDGEVYNLGLISGYANSINDAGQIVGEINNRGFVINGGVLTYLDDLLVDNSSFHMNSAKMINNKGQIIGFSSDSQGWVLMNPVPEPSSLLALVSGIATLGFLKGRR